MFQGVFRQSSGMVFTDQVSRFRGGGGGSVLYLDYKTLTLPDARHIVSRIVVWKVSGNFLEYMSTNPRISAYNTSWPGRAAVRYKVVKGSLKLVQGGTRWCEAVHMHHLGKLTCNKLQYQTTKELHQQNEISVTFLAFCSKDKRNVVIKWQLCYYLVQNLSLQNMLTLHTCKYTPPCKIFLPPFSATVPFYHIRFYIYFHHNPANLKS
jgi:hypothetical protein